MPEPSTPHSRGHARIPFLAVLSLTLLAAAGGAVVPCVLAEDVPGVAPEEGERGPGLLVTVRDRERSASFVMSAPHFCLQPGESLHPAVGSAFEARWEGWLVVEDAALYSFTSAPGGLGLEQDVELEVDGARVSGRGPPIELEAGPHALRLGFRRADPTVPVRLELRWRSEHFAEEPLPAAALWLGPAVSRAAP